MAEKNPDYLEQQLECTITKEKLERTFRFQQEKIKLDDPLEISMLTKMDQDIHREIEMTEDELNIKVKPAESYQNFSELHKKDRHSRWVFAHQLVEKVKSHTYPRLHLIVAPDNLVLTKGLAPSFLHYGVKESLPPYEKDEERIWHEVRAVIAAAVDEKFTFEQYIKFHDTLQVSTLVKEIFDTKTTEELSALISRKIVLLEEKERSLVHIPEKKWKTFRYVGLGLLILLIPAIIYTAYSVFFLQPRAEAYVQSGKDYQTSNYSDVINGLEKYKVEDMPDIVKYQLAHSYVVTGDFVLDQQKENIRKDLTLRTDNRYYEFFIRMGRGESEKALEIARNVGDPFTITVALIQYKADIQADKEMKSEERQAKIKELESEIADNTKRLKETKAQAEEEEKKKQEALDKVKEEEAKEAAETKPQQPAAPAAGTPAAPKQPQAPAAGKQPAAPPAGQTNPK
ncbi:type VII secretion protein EssB [Bacillus sp. FJAT-42376]|uniref:type VII secretion protein EssB n=1 Tax=Bacillus sp. FJAT-42376 TaxID=2014076 RepID=UPI000F4E372B|nr:type VII secretion protein EssB [Bacillus sp. FJAT-42376]AZB40857.1 type VII secretion protein EssB [Bacillus sp. FJAT-42376]